MQRTEQKEEKQIFEKEKVEFKLKFWNSAEALTFKSFTYCQV